MFASLTFFPGIQWRISITTLIFNINLKCMPAILIFKTSTDCSACHDTNWTIQRFVREVDSWLRSLCKCFQWLCGILVSAPQVTVSLKAGNKIQVFKESLRTHPRFPILPNGTSSHWLSPQLTWWYRFCEDLEDHIFPLASLLVWKVSHIITTTHGSYIQIFCHLPPNPE